MISWKETDLSGRYKRSNDVDLLVGCSCVKNISQGIVERDKRLSCSCCTISNDVLIVLVAAE